MQKSGLNTKVDLRSSVLHRRPKVEVNYETQGKLPKVGPNQCNLDCYRQEDFFDSFDSYQSYGSFCLAS